MWFVFQVSETKKLDEQKNIKKTKVTVTPKIVLRDYEYMPGTQSSQPAAGVGANLKLTKNEFTLNSSISVVRGKKLELDEGRLSLSIPVKKINGNITPEIYFDKFYRIEAKHPAGAVMVKSGPVKVAFAHSFTYTLQYLKYTEPKTGLGFKGILLESSGKEGYFAQIGKLQKAGAAISIPASVLGVKIDTEVQMLVKVSKAGLDGKPGDPKMLNIRLVITPK